MKRYLPTLTAALLGGLVSALTVLAVVRAPSAPNIAPHPPLPLRGPGAAGGDGGAPAAAAPLSQPHIPVLVSSRNDAIRPAPVDLRNAARVATPAVVHITALGPGRRREAVKQLLAPRESNRYDGGQGSGVIYTSNGYIVTNYHVVAGAAEITVTTSDRRRFAAALAGVEPRSDLAVLKIEATELPFLQLADSDAAEPGQWVLAVGSPLGLTSTVTAGIISARGRNLSLFPELDAIESFLQTDAAVNPGNSGGPLVNERGQLLGINTAIATRTGQYAGYSFAIPINLVRRIADDLIEFGSYRRAYLGVEISTLTQTDIRRIRPGRTEGVIIDAIFADGSAAAAGLRVDDLIVAIDGRPIRDLPELTELIGRAQVGETLNFGVVRNGKAVEVVVKLLP